MSLVGTMIGRYQLGEMIGEGGTGQVYRAWDAGLEREVAIKLLRREGIQAREGVERFLREIRALARIEHPGIVRIYDAGLTADESPYIVMELIRGESLREKLDKEIKIAPGDVAQILVQAAEALQVAHDAGIIHRDLKPENISLVMTGDEVSVKILDFGIARLAEIEETVTGPGVLIGTLAYMSPEQAQSRKSVDHRSDIFALGIVGYEALSGERPFTGDGVFSLIQQIVTKELPSLHLADPATPAELDSLLLSMLERDPALRPQSMREVASRVRWLALEKAAIKPEPSFESKLKRTVVGAAPSAAQGQSVPGPTAKRDISSSSPVRMESAADVFPPKASESKRRKRDPLEVFKVPPEPLVVPTGGHGVPRPEAEETQEKAHEELAKEAAIEPIADDAPRLVTALPPEMKGHAPTIARFLRATFTEIERVAPGVLRLHGNESSRSANYQFYTLFMGATVSSPERLGTRTFLNYSLPLESRLATFDGEVRKVVITIVDSPEIGAGVHRKILEYRSKYNAYVVPLHLGELRKAEREGRAAALFEDRLSEFHTREDMYESREPVRDPTRFYGMKRELNELIAALGRISAFISVTGPPGSGKTSLVNMAEYGLEGFVAVHLRASEAIERLAEPFAAEIIGRLLPQGAEAPPAGAMRERMTQAARAAQASAQKAGHRVMLVIEDADWLLHPLVDPRAPPDEQRKTRELWTALAEISRRVEIAVVVTSFYGFTLSKRKMLDWENPAAATVRILRIERLDLPSIERMLRELGAEMNVSVHPEALAEIHALSGGNIDLARRLASRALRRERERQPGRRPLDAITIHRKTVIEVARELESLPGTFEKTVMSLLQAVDRMVLQCVAVHRPSSVRALKEALLGAFAPAECADSVDRLHEMGFLDVTDGRIQVAIPMLAAWVRQHVEHVPGEVQRSRNRRARIIGVGVTLTALCFGVYWSWFKSKSALSDPVSVEGCAYRVRYPERGASGETVPLYVFRDCATGVTPAPVDMVTAMGTVARIDAKLGGKSDIMSCKPGSDCRMVEIPVALVSPGQSDYELRLEAGPSPIAELRIHDDPLAAMKRTLDGAIQVAAALPALLAMLLAFHQDVARAVRRLFGVFTGKPLEETGTASDGEH